MPRPPIERAVSGEPRITLFKPAGVPARELEQLRLGVDEFEAIRLVDLEGLSHGRAAEAMGVSRQTVGRVLERGRARVAEALVGGKAILIGGGQYRVEPQRYRCVACGECWIASGGPGAATSCPACGASDVTACWGGGDRCAGPPCASGPDAGGAGGECPGPGARGSGAGSRGVGGRPQPDDSQTRR
jgi:uncharacterized protein